MPHARPLSPHLSIYEWRITMVLSILHRVTGAFLCVGLAVVAWGLVALAAGEGAWSTFAGFWGSWIGLILLVCWTFSLFLHLCNGIRHLFWDAGHGFQLALHEERRHDRAGHRGDAGAQQHLLEHR